MSTETRRGAATLVFTIAVVLAACGTSGGDDNGDADDAKLRVANASCEGALDEIAPGGALASYTFSEWGTISIDLESASGPLPELWSAKPALEIVAECTYRVDPEAPPPITCPAPATDRTVAAVVDTEGNTLPDARAADDQSCSADED